MQHSNINRLKIWHLVLILSFLLIEISDAYVLDRSTNNLVDVAGEKNDAKRSVKTGDDISSIDDKSAPLSDANSNNNNNNDDQNKNKNANSEDDDYFHEEGVDEEEAKKRDEEKKRQAEEAAKRREEEENAKKTNNEEPDPSLSLKETDFGSFLTNERIAELLKNFQKEQMEKHKSKNKSDIDHQLWSVITLTLFFGSGITIGVIIVLVRGRSFQKSKNSIIEKNRRKSDRLINNNNNNNNNNNVITNGATSTTVNLTTDSNNNNEYVAVSQNEEKI